MYTKAIIVSGGGSHEENTLWKGTKPVSKAAYQALIYQGFSKQDIFYLSPDGGDIDADDNGILGDDVILNATNEKLRYAIETWARDAENLLIFITDHGKDGEFLINRNERLHAVHSDAACSLSTWLDDVEEIIPGMIMVIYDAWVSSKNTVALINHEGQTPWLNANGNSDIEYAEDKRILRSVNSAWRTSRETRYPV